MLKIAAPGARHTLAVIAHATGAVIIGKLSYSEAKRYLEEDHSVYVTRATIQKWVNADEETKRLLIESDEESRRRLDNFFR